MRVLEINKYHYLKGGVDTVFFNTIRLLKEMGNDVCTFCTDNPKNTESAFARYFTHAPELRDLSTVEKIKNIGTFFWNKDSERKIELLINQEKPDIAHLHNIFNGISMSILPVLRRHNIPVVITMHDTRFVCPSSLFNTRGNKCKNCLKFGGLPCGLFKCYQNNFINSMMCAFEMLQKEKLFDYNRYIDRYIFVSKRFQDFHAARHSYFKDKGTILHNFMPGMDEISPCHTHDNYMLFYGRITAEKGIAALISAMRDLPDIKLKVVGDGPLRESLEQQAPANVEFLGFKKGDALFEQVRHASFVIVPSECEDNNPLTIIEAYSHGKPVIGSITGGIPEIVTPDTGFLFEMGNVEQLKRCIMKANVINAETYRQMSIASRKFALSNFSPEIHYKKLMGIFNETIASHEDI